MTEGAWRAVVTRSQESDTAETEYPHAAAAAVAKSLQSVFPTYHSHRW